MNSLGYETILIHLTIKRSRRQKCAIFITFRLYIVTTLILYKKKKKDEKRDIS